MKLYNLKENEQVVNFETAVKTGLGKNQGLFFPKKFQPFEDIDNLLSLNTFERNYKILNQFVSDCVDQAALKQIIDKTFAFPSPIQAVTHNIFCLELFHGPTLAFKDFGATFMANCLRYFAKDNVRNKPITILTATSGDTGAAVAHAFHHLENINVVILFPKGKISELQQKMFTTLGDNIKTIAIEGTFDDCQALVKQSFDDNELVETVGLNSANSINISRLLAQVCYYFEAVAQLPETARNNLVVSVPSGNFGNLCAGIIAKCLGLPIKRFVAATNLNDTVPRYLQSGEWSPNETVATLSNAMDVSRPNNWPRIQYLIDSKQFAIENLTGQAINEERTKATLQALKEIDYLSEPHASVAYASLSDTLRPGETGLFLGTAHPAKFKDSVDEILNTDISLPQALQDCAQKDDLSVNLSANFKLLRDFLIAAHGPTSQD